MKRISVIFLSLFLLISCQNIERSPEPEGLIPPEKMVEILTDISLVHGARTYNKSVMKTKGISPEEFIWERHNVDSLQFARSNDYYAENYEMYKTIYDSVKSRLESLKIEYDSIRMREERRLDSLKTLELNDSAAAWRPKRVIPDSLVPPVNLQREVDTTGVRDWRGDSVR